MNIRDTIHTAPTPLAPLTPLSTCTTSRSDTRLTSALAIVPERSAVNKSSQRGLGAGSLFTSRPLEMDPGRIVHSPPLATPPRMTAPRREPLQRLDRDPKAFGPSSRHGMNVMSDGPYSGQRARQAYLSHLQGANSTNQPCQLSHRSSRPTSRVRYKDLPILPRLRRRHTSSKPPSISALRPLTVPSRTPIPSATPDPVKEMYAGDESASSRERWLRTRPMPQLESEREIRPLPRMRHSMSVSGLDSGLRQTVKQPDLPSRPQEDRQMFQDGRRGLHSSVTHSGPAESLSLQSPRSFLSGPRYDHPASVGTTLSFPENWASSFAHHHNGHACHMEEHPHARSPCLPRSGQSSAVSQPHHHLAHPYSYTSSIRQTQAHLHPAAMSPKKSHYPPDRPLPVAHPSSAPRLTLSDPSHPTMPSISALMNPGRSGSKRGREC